MILVNSISAILSFASIVLGVIALNTYSWCGGSIFGGHGNGYGCIFILPALTIADHIFSPAVVGRSLATPHA